MRVTRSFSILSFCLILFCGFPGILSSAAAQQQEKRIALVVGDGAYAKSPLATAANDAGLIAQTLQAAGFDVVGARDLDGDTLRRSFRDFIQKAEASGPDTVAVVYLAGYGMQLAGENYFIPVDSTVSRDTDIPTEGMRINDYVRQLASLPLKAGVVVLDAARQQPFVEGGQPLASGLALVEPDAHMLIAFNAAPGTIAPTEQGPYGVYAQSLAEMIRTGGLSLPEVFNRVRLRVNELSKGAQVPWDAEKIDGQFMFFNRAPDAPAPAAPDQAAAVRGKPIRDLGAQDAYAAALERDTMQGYEDFLTAYPNDPLAKRVRAIAAARREAITWLRSYRADTPQAYWSYLRRYPRGPHAGDARRRLAILIASLEPPPSFAVIDYDVPPPPPDEIVYVDRPVLMFSDPEFDFAPPPPPPLFFLPPPPPDFIVLEPPPPPIGLFILPQPFFVPIPVYVQQPVYVVPPPNNIIFANIHNTTVINNVINRPPQPGAGNVQPNAKGVAAPPGVKGAPGQGGVAQPGTGPALPPAVAQRASLIQQGKLAVPPSASINPAARLGTPGTPSGQRVAPNTPVPTNVSPNALPQALPKTNALPVPGAKGTPPAPPSAAAPVPGPPNPNAKLAPQDQPRASEPALRAGQPKAGGSAQAPEAKPVVPETVRRPNAAPPPPPPPKPAAAPPKPAPRAEPKPQMQRAEPPHRAAPPPRPAPQMARPSPPPPRAAPPPPRMAAPPPPRPAPPPPRPAPQIARPAPPPPRPAPPPPRPAAPAAAKKCPPNVPRC
ncbi:MAG TPA: caspase family protein [Bradyrhizobium sp.]